jgi:hypothetical protein
MLVKKGQAMRATKHEREHTNHASALGMASLLHNGFGGGAGHGAGALNASCLPFDLAARSTSLAL